MSSSPIELLIDNGNEMLEVMALIYNDKKINKFEMKLKKFLTYLRKNYPEIMLENE